MRLARPLPSPIKLPAPVKVRFSDIVGQRVGGHRGQHGVGALPRVLDHDVTSAFDDIGIVAKAAAHYVIACAAIEPVVTISPVQRIVAGKAEKPIRAAKPGDHIVPARCPLSYWRSTVADDIRAASKAIRVQRGPIFSRRIQVEYSHDLLRHQATSAACKAEIRKREILQEISICRRSRSRQQCRRRCSSTIGAVPDDLDLVPLAVLDVAERGRRRHRGIARKIVGIENVRVVGSGLQVGDRDCRRCRTRCRDR